MVYGRRLLDNLDVTTIGVALALVAIGIVGIASATHDEADGSGLWQRQVIWALIALVVGAIVVAIDYHIWAELALALHAAAMAGLVAVLFFGRTVAGNQSWLVFGPMRLQPSELAKWTTCLVLAAYLALRVRDRIRLRHLIEMGILVGMPMGLIAAQPDDGTALTFLPIYAAAVLLGGVRWKVVGIVMLIMLPLLPIGWTQLNTYQKERILTTLDPGRDPEGVGYQARQSKIAIGSGGLTGKGVFRGTQSQLKYLPAQHTDFVMAVLAEELGFVGAASVLGLFYFLLVRGLAAARLAQDRLGTYMCLLVVAWLLGQLTINIGMVLGQLPTIGVPLPLVSYGGSALLATACGIGLIVNVRTRRFVNV